MFLWQVHFIDDFVFMIGKGCMPLSYVQNPWVQRIVFRCNSRILFPMWKALVKEHISTMYQKTIDMYLLPMLDTCQTMSITFDFWMSHVGFDTFTIIILLNFIKDL